jgi:outer membrane lipoprotein SlyB
MAMACPYRILGVALLTALVGACAAGTSMNQPTTQLGEQQIQYGNIVQINPVTLEGDHQLGLGAVIGAAAGGLLGSLVGGGSGRDVAVVIGAIGGGVAGNEVQNNYVDKKPGSHIIVHLDNGVHVAITQPLNPDLYVGERVMIQGSGQSARVVPP